MGTLLMLGSAVSATLLATAGCGGSGFPVGGTVTLDGAPVSGATVMLVPRGSGRTGKGVTGPDGRFEVALPDGTRGMPAGDYSVTVMHVTGSVRKKSDIKASGLRPNEELGGAVDQDAQQVVEYLVPKKYALPETSGLSASVAGATRDLKIELNAAGP